MKISKKNTKVWWNALFGIFLSFFGIFLSVFGLGGNKSSLAEVESALFAVESSAEVWLRSRGLLTGALDRLTGVTGG